MEKQKDQQDAEPLLHPDPPKPTLIVGASPNTGRFAYRAAHLLKSHNHPIVPMGIRKGEVAGTSIIDIRERPPVGDIHTITLYINPTHQEEWMEYLISLKPKRIIFNPGTENETFEKKAREAGIEVLEACTLVMLNQGHF